MKGMSLKIYVKQFFLLSLTLSSCHMYAPWFEYVKEGNENAVEFMLKEKKQPVDERDGCRKTAMHYAAQYGYIQIAELLLKYYADVNETNKNRWTPLHTAASFNRVEMIEWLVKHGADMYSENLHHWKPVDIAKSDAKECLRLLMNRKKTVDEQKKHRADAVAAARGLK